MNLLEYRRNVHSQYGEDGVLAKIFEVLGIVNGTCVEFGAWDGELFSNTCNLIDNMGWEAVLIEGSEKKFPILKKRFENNPRVNPLQCIIDFDPPENLDTILSLTSLPQDFDLLSIDIDGNDYHILDSLKQYKPKVIVIEFNPSIPNHLNFVQGKDMKVNHGSSLKAITDLAKTKGYELICATDANGIYVDKQYYSCFNIPDNSLDILHTDRNYQTFLIQLYDGTVVVAGQTHLIWHGCQIDNERIQVLPRELRKFPDHL